MVAAADDRVEQVLICTPDKDLGQCVGGKVVQLDRRKGVVYDAAGVTEKFGVPPDVDPRLPRRWSATRADGFPGLPGWGAKSAAAVLARYGHLEDIPADAGDWDIARPRRRPSWRRRCASEFDLALLFRRIATIEPDAPTIDERRRAAVDRPHRPTPSRQLAERIGAPGLAGRARKLAAGGRARPSNTGATPTGMARLSSKGHVTIPIELRVQLGHPGCDPLPNRFPGALDRRAGLSQPFLGRALGSSSGHGSGSARNWGALKEFARGWRSSRPPPA